jgi:sigma-70-like protein
VTKSGDLHLFKADERRAAEYAALVRRAADGDAAAMEDLLVRAQEGGVPFQLSRVWSHRGCGRRDAGRAASHVPACPPDSAAGGVSLGIRLRAALNASPSRLRVLVFLRDMAGLSNREVARVMRISEANAKTRLHRAPDVAQGT